jgi:hypothetical protein
VPAVSSARARVPAALAPLDRARVAGALRLWPWLPLAFAAAYVVVLAVHLRGIVQGIYLSSDVVSAPYIGELYGQAPPGADVVLGNFPWYTTLWFEQLTHGLPGHRAIWQLGPWIASLVGVGLVSWSTYRAAGRWAGMVVAVALGCAGPALLTYQFAASIHALTFVHVCLLGAFLVLCATRREGLVAGRGGHAVLSVLLAGVTAAGLASDKLLLFAGIVPFMVAGLVMGRGLAAPAGRRIAVSCVLIGAASLIGASLIGAAMEAADVRAHHFDIFYAGYEQFVPHAQTFLQGMAYLFNGDFGGQKPSFAADLTVACAVVLALAAAVAYRVGRRRLGAAISGGLDRPAGGVEAVRVAHVAFWTLAGSMLAITYVFSSLPVNQFTARYLLTVGYAIAALVPLAAVARGAGARALVTLGVCVLVGGSILGHARGDIIQDNPSQFPTGTVSGPLLRLAQEEHIKYGYAGYWDAAPLTWQMGAKLQLYPVEMCGPPRMCPFPFHKISSWYRPRPNTRTMLVVDHLQLNVGPREPGMSLGKPDRAVSIGQLTAYIYPYDIASRFG